MRMLAGGTTEGGGETLPLEVGEDGVRLIAVAIQTALSEIDAEEFRTRLGVEPSVAASFLSDLGRPGSEIWWVSRSPVPAGVEVIVGDGLLVTETHLLLANNALNEVLFGLSKDCSPPSFRRAEAALLLPVLGEILDGVGPNGADDTPTGADYVDHLR